MKLTPDQLQQNAKAMEAFAAGKAVQWQDENGIWFDTDGIGSIHLLPYRPKPWSLPEPPPGKKWNKDGWTEAMLPEGWRPLLEGEPEHPDDEINSTSNPDYSGWVKVTGTFRDGIRVRTRRPLPAEPKTRAWNKPEDVPGPVCWIRLKEKPDWHALITFVDRSGIILAESMTAGGPEAIIWGPRFRDYEYSTDRKTWHPCTVTE